jgi:hypothetical protein
VRTHDDQVALVRPGDGDDFVNGIPVGDFSFDSNRGIGGANLIQEPQQHRIIVRHWRGHAEFADDDLGRRRDMEQNQPAAMIAREGTGQVKCVLGLRRKIGWLKNRFESKHCHTSYGSSGNSV